MKNEPQNETLTAPRSTLGRKIAIVAVLAIAVGGVLWGKAHHKENADPGAPGVESAARADAEPVAAASGALPRLVDLGAGKCVPCKMMAPILEELKRDHAGRLEVIVIDITEIPDAAKQYNINLIPTQIFYAADGKELFRHEGFFAKEDILAKWKELGVDLEKVGRTG
ncbi:MAG: thioredoxin family protein [Candidatus Sumerlaeota bacterium]|nr:thioredoxin family protein [Candidatus Sumerlaeota bacterium]